MHGQRPAPTCLLGLLWLEWPQRPEVVAWYIVGLSQLQAPVRGVGWDAVPSCSGCTEAAQRMSVPGETPRQPEMQSLHPTPGHSCLFPCWAVMGLPFLMLSGIRTRTAQGTPGQYRRCKNIHSSEGLQGQGRTACEGLPRNGWRSRSIFPLNVAKAPVTANVNFLRQSGQVWVAHEVVCVALIRQGERHHVCLIVGSRGWSWTALQPRTWA